MSVIVVDEDRALEARSLVRLMEGVLDGVVRTYQTSGVSLPERRYWTLSPPAVDCEQLVVTFIQAYIGPPGDEASVPQRCDAVKTAVLQVQVHRCVPVASAKGKAPTPMSIIQASEQLAMDAYLLLDSANGLEQWDTIGPGLGVISTVEVTEPQGGYQGVILNLTLAIP